MSRVIDPFKLLGDPSTWPKFGTGKHDEACDAERRATRDFFLRRLAKNSRKGNVEATTTLMSGASCCFAELFIASAGGVDEIKDDAFDNYIAIMTFAWYQAVNHFNEGGVQ